MDGSRSADNDATVDGLVLACVSGLPAEGARVAFTLQDRPCEAVARSLIPLHPGDIGATVVLMFEAGKAARPVVIGRLQGAAPGPPPPEVTADGERVEITAASEVVLRCGKASLTLARSGKIVLRGTYILSRSSGPNRIKGGSVQLN